MQHMAHVVHTLRRGQKPACIDRNGTPLHSTCQPLYCQGAAGCLDAFTVALGQVYDEERDRRWYTSTLELQLASLDFCWACRKVPTSRLRVEDGTPGILLNALAAEQLQRPRSSSPQNRGSSRVPPLRASRVNLSFPLWLNRPDNMRLWKAVEELDLGGYGQGRSRSLRLPATLKKLKVDMELSGPFPEWLWPASLQRLELVRFSRSIIGAAWPPALRQLSVGDRFNQPVAGVKWPASLQQLSPGHCFNQPIGDVVWPTTLLSLHFGFDFNQPIVSVVWPVSLQRLSFGHSFNQPIVDVVWPTSLLKLDLGVAFNQPIAGVTWPASLQQLKFGKRFNQHVVAVVWPASLRRLEFGELFNQPIAGVCAWPPRLQHIQFGTGFDHPMSGVLWPASLVRVKHGKTVWYDKHRDSVLIHMIPSPEQLGHSPED